MAGLKEIRRRILPRTLFGRSLLIIVVPVLLMQMIVAYVFINRHWDSMDAKLVSALAGEIDMVTTMARQAGSDAAVGKIVKLASDNLDMQVTIETSGEKVIPSRKPAYPIWNSVGDNFKKALKEKFGDSFSISSYPKSRLFEVHVPLDDQRILKYLVYGRRLTSPTTYIFLLWLIGSSIVLLAVAVVFMRNQIRPIHRLAVAAEKLGKGQDVATFKPEGAREVRQAAKAFMEMRDRIRRQIEQRTAMLAGVSHDLRTPLTRMKLQLAMAKNIPEIDNLRQDLDEMEKMLEGYLAFARGEGDEQTEQVDLKSMLDRIVNNARRQGHKAEFSCDGSLMMQARPVALERAVANIVSNACKYAKHVWITAHGDPDEIEIIVEDDGPGIPKTQREEVFKPFYRIEKSRNPKSGGVGLGLSIAQDIIHGHGGEILLEDSSHRGLKVIIRLPV